jgi:hypothetical protein
VSEQLNDKDEHYYEVPEHPPYKQTGRPSKAVKTATAHSDTPVTRPSRPRTKP